jgi:H+/Cl- antiporter ClcA/predicted transcriptional regulator
MATNIYFDMKNQSDGAPAADGAIPVSPALDDLIKQANASSTDGLRAPAEYEPVDQRTIVVTALAVLIAAGAGLAAQILLHLIGFVTNVAFYGRLSTAFVSPGGGHRAPLALLLIPILGGIIVGIMARYGSAAIRGHGIPEVMEKVLFGESRIPARVLILKPLSAAIAIGTGGPFGAEGPIIATGGALGSLAGQVIRVTADERKTLLGAGAAAGMAATFGTPVSAVLLAVELLLFEYRPRSLIPVALAAAVATGVRIAFDGTAPVFTIPALHQPSGVALVSYAVLGVLIGVIAAGITRFAYGIETWFERWGKRFGVDWMWWPAFGAIAVGVIGLIEPRTLGVGYDNIVGAIAGTIAGRALIALVVLKLLSWAIYLGSGTSGGTLAPLFTIGGGLGAWIGAIVASNAPGLGVDANVAGLVGMAAMFAGASHAVLASVVFAFETTRQPVGLLPLLVGCTAAFLVSLLLNRHSIMTEKLARRGVSVRSEYSLDYLSRVRAGDVGKREVVTLSADSTVSEAMTWLDTGTAVVHQGFPVVDEDDLLVGVLTRRDIFAARDQPNRRLSELIQRAPVVVFEHHTLRDAADQMVLEHVGRVPIVRRDDPRRVIGILSRSDLLTAHAPRLKEAREVRRVRSIARPFSER